MHVVREFAVCQFSGTPAVDLSTGVKGIRSWIRTLVFLATAGGNPRDEIAQARNISIVGTVSGAKEFPGVVVLLVFGWLIFALARTMILNPEIESLMWSQGDWLIHTMNGPIRRGPFGSLILAISDSLSAHPMAVVMTLQMAFLAALSVVVLLSLHRLGFHEMSCLLVLLPGFFLCFWAAEPGAMRKEQIAFLAMAIPLLAYGSPALRRPLGVLALGVMMLALAGHELGIPLLPAFCLLYFICLHPKRAEILAVGAIVSLAGALALHYSVSNKSVADLGGICQPLIERNVMPGVCGGAIAALEQDAGSAVESVYSNVVGKFRFIGPVLAIFFIRAGTFALIKSMSHAHHLRRLWWLTLLPILPLFVVAIDWGRWISLHMTSFVLILLALLLSGAVTPARDLALREKLAFVAFGLLWAPDTTTRINIGGLAIDVLLLPFEVLGVV